MTVRHPALKYASKALRPRKPHRAWLNLNALLDSEPFWLAVVLGLSAVVLIWRQVVVG